MNMYTRACMSMYIYILSYIYILCIHISIGLRQILNPGLNDPSSSHPCRMQRQIDHRRAVDVSHSDLDYFILLMVQTSGEKTS